MLKSDIVRRYPWYEKHQNAVFTIVACLKIDMGEVLETLDKKLGKQEKHREKIQQPAEEAA